MGNSRTELLACVSPSNFNLEDGASSNHRPPKNKAPTQPLILRIPSIYLPIYPSIYLYMIYIYISYVPISYVIKIHVHMSLGVCICLAFLIWDRGLLGFLWLRV